MITTKSITVDVTAAGTEHVWRVTGDYFPGDPGQTSGRPEVCYPPEPEEMEVTAVLMLDPYGKDVLCDAMDTGIWTALRDEVSLSIYESATDAMRDVYDEVDERGRPRQMYRENAE